MVKIVFSIALALCCALSAHGQTPIIYDLNKARLEWSWTQGTGPNAYAYQVACAGEGEATYTRVRYVYGSTTLTTPVRDVVRGPGKYRCVVFALGEYASPGSNEISFEVSDVPPVATGLTIKPQ